MDPATPLPAVLVGAWLRRSVQLGADAPGEPARVLWLQSAGAFADVRLPRPGATGPFATLEAFAGTTTWHAASAELSWAHDVDLAGTFAGVDRAAVAWDGDDTMIETGHLVVDGTPAPYTERWARIATGPSRAERWADVGGTGVCVEIGALSLTVATDARGVVRAVFVADGSTVASVGPDGVEVDHVAFDALVGAPAVVR